MVMLMGMFTLTSAVNGKTTIGNLTQDKELSESFNTLKKLDSEHGLELLISLKEMLT